MVESPSGRSVARAGRKPGWATTTWPTQPLIGGTLVKKYAFLLLAGALLTGTASASGWGNRGASCGPACNAPTCTTVTCDPCADACRPSLMDRLRGLFHRDRCCEPVCNPCPAPVCNPCPAPKCVPVCVPTCAPTCDPCCSRPNLLDRLRGLFHRDRCCDPCCDPCAGGTVTVAPKSGEVITTPPKKLPNPKAEPKVKGAAVVVPPAQPIAPPAIRDVPTVPALDIDNRRPF